MDITNEANFFCRDLPEAQRYVKLFFVRDKGELEIGFVRYYRSEKARHDDYWNFASAARETYRAKMKRLKQTAGGVK